MQAPFPQLQVLALEKLLLHEEVGADRVERLREQLVREGLLRNPPVAAPLGSGNFLLLDGATRVTALQSLGCSAVVAHVVEYPGEAVTVRTWSHFLPGWELETFAHCSRQLGFTLQHCSLPEAQRALAERTCIAVATTDGQEALTLQPPPEFSLAASLRQLVHTYARSGHFQRVSWEEVSLLRRHGEPLSGVFLMFPTFSAEEIRQLALSGERLPSGITQHLVAGRLLHANIPLVELLSPTSVEEKNTWLQQWWQERLRCCRLRYYPEPTFVLEE